MQNLEIQTMSKVIVVGGGAAGMFAAYFAAQNGHSVTLLEKNEKLGKKIYINESITKRGIQYQFELPSIKEQELFKYYISLKRDL